MSISAREKMIIEKLLKASHEVTMEELAKEISVSTRTIHRDLSGIEMFLKEFNLTLTRKTGVGIQMAGSVENKERLKRQLMTFTLHEYMAEERQTLILSILYEAAEPVKMFTLANELQVTVATISNDLLKLEEKLLDFQLSIIRKRGYGVELSGSEEAKRRAISYHLADSLSEDEFLSLIKRSMERKSTIGDNVIAERLLHLVDREKVFVIEEMLRDLNTPFIKAMTDNAYVGLVVHLTLAIDRIQRGEKIEMAADFLKQLQEEPEYVVAEKMIHQLAKRFQITIPNAEIGYITMHLQGAKLRVDEESALESEHLQVVMQAKALIQKVEELTNCSLANHAPLLEGLVTHLKPALYRIHQKMIIVNPLLSNIRADYEELFEVVKEACQKIFVDTKIPDEEIGFLVLHFGAAIIGLKEEAILTAYVVCSSGIGTSKMLATQLRREIPAIAEIKNVSAFELAELPIQETDLVISTICLRDFSNEYIAVSPFLTDEEIQQVQFLAKRKLLLQKSAAIPTRPVLSGKDILKRMNRMHHYTGMMSTLLTDFCLVNIEKKLSIKEYIDYACLELEDKGIIQHAKEVAHALFARKALGGLGIPGTTLALFHTTHEKILKPSFTMYTVREPLIVEAMDGTMIEMKTILLLLAPDVYDQSGMEVLSLISASIIENEQSIELFQSGDEQMIYTQLGRKFEQFLHEKIQRI